jgi:serine/threonine protein kinase
LRVRRTFDQFEIVREVGFGGMSRVFEAEDTALGRRVGLKILNRECSRDAARLAQFEREAWLTASFSHPHIVKVFSVGRDQGYFYIAMELVPGGSLDDRIQSGGAQPEGEVLSLAVELVQGLRAAQAAGLIHRDIKPGNILYANDGTAKIVDFGLALIQGKDVDESEELWATPFYVPPEKLYGEPDTYRGDMYSLGASLFHALAGRPPCGKDTNSIEALRKIKSFPVHLGPIAPQVSDETCAIVDRLLARKPEHRYRNYDELLEHFEFARKRLKERATQHHSKRALWWQRHAAQVGAAAAVVIGLVLGAIFLGGQRHESKAEKSPAGMGASSQASEQATTTKFFDARQSLLEGNFAKAHLMFEEIASAASTRQPTLSWAWFNAGVAALLQGDRATASRAFAALANQSGWATTPEDTELTRFFSDASRWLANSATISLDLIEDLSGPTVRSAALLPLGLVLWDEGRSDDAAEFFQRFREAMPPASAAWIESYKSLLDPYLADLETARRLPLMDERVPLKQAIDNAQRAETMIAGMRVPRGLKPRLAARLKDFRSALNRREKEEVVAREAEMSRLAQQEMERIDAAAAQVRTLRSGYRFQQGVDALSAFEARTPSARQRRDDLVYLWRSAEEFMKQLGEDVQNSRFTGEIDRFAAPPLKGTVTRTQRDKWIVRVGANDQVIEVGTVAPACLVSLAENFAEQTADSDQYYRRRENIVAFAKLCDLNDYARIAGQALMRESRDFRERWPRLAQLN